MAVRSERGETAALDALDTQRRTAARLRGRALLQRRAVAVSRHLLLIAVAIPFLVPFYWLVISSFKSNAQIFARPMQWWPNPIQWDNFERTIHYPNFPYFRFLWNSTFYAGMVTIGTVISSAAVGYGFASVTP